MTYTWSVRRYVQSSDSSLSVISSVPIGTEKWRHKSSPDNSLLSWHNASHFIYVDYTEVWHIFFWNYASPQNWIPNWYAGRTNQFVNSTWVGVQHFSLPVTPDRTSMRNRAQIEDWPQNYIARCRFRHYNILIVHGRLRFLFHIRQIDDRFPRMRHFERDFHGATLHRMKHVMLARILYRFKTHHRRRRAKGNL